MVRKGGLEPPRPLGHRILSPARLPIPPLSRGRDQPAAAGPDAPRESDSGRAVLAFRLPYRRSRSGRPRRRRAGGDGRYGSVAAVQRGSGGMHRRSKCSGAFSAGSSDAGRGEDLWHGSGTSAGGRQGGLRHLVPEHPRTHGRALRPVEPGRLLRATHTPPASRGVLRGAHPRVQRQHVDQARARASGRRRRARAALRPRHRSREPGRGGRGRGRVVAEPRDGPRIRRPRRPDGARRARSRRRRARRASRPAPRPGRVHLDRARGAAPGDPGVHVAPAAAGPEAPPRGRRGGRRGGGAGRRPDPRSRRPGHAGGGAGRDSVRLGQRVPDPRGRRARVRHRPAQRDQPRVSRVRRGGRLCRSPMVVRDGLGVERGRRGPASAVLGAPGGSLAMAGDVRDGAAAAGLAGVGHPGRGGRLRALEGGPPADRGRVPPRRLRDPRRRRAAPSVGRRAARRHARPLRFPGMGPGAGRLFPRRRERVGRARPRRQRLGVDLFGVRRVPGFRADGLVPGVLRRLLRRAALRHQGGRPRPPRPAWSGAACATGSGPTTRSSSRASAAWRTCRGDRGGGGPRPLRGRRAARSGPPAEAATAPVSLRRAGVAALRGDLRPARVPDHPGRAAAAGRPCRRDWRRPRRAGYDRRAGGRAAARSSRRSSSP